MMKKEVYRAYEEMKPDTAAKERMLAKILDAARDMQDMGEETEMGREMLIVNQEKQENHIGRKTGRSITRRWQMVAALALVIVIPAATAYAMDLFGLRDMGIGKTVVTDPVVAEETENYVPQHTQREVDVISLQGFTGSPEAAACEEWRAFYETYDADGMILAEIGDQPTGLDSRYDAYPCYTQEMIDQVDRICEKYQLSMLIGLDIAETYEELRDKIGIGDILGGVSEHVQHETADASFYSNGSFSLDSKAVIDDIYVTDYQIGREMKGYFSPFYLNIGNIDSYEQWEYTTAGGQTVLLANSSSKALIIVDLERSFVVVNIFGDIWGGTFDVNNERLEMLADSFDFSALQ